MSAHRRALEFIDEFHRVFDDRCADASTAVDVLVLEAETASRIRQPERAYSALLLALERLPETDRTRGLVEARVLSMLGEVSLVRSSPNPLQDLLDAVDHYRAAKGTLETLGDTDSVFYAQTLLGLAKARSRLDNFDPRVFALCTRAIDDILTPLHRERPLDAELSRALASALTDYAGFALRLLDHEHVSALYRRALHLRLELGDYRAAARSMQSLALLHYGIRDFETARRHLDEADSILADLGYRATHPRRTAFMPILAALHLERGELEEAERLQRFVIETLADTQPPGADSYRVAAKRILLSTLLHAQGRCDAGFDEASRAMETLRVDRHGNDVWQSVLQAAFENSWCRGDSAFAAEAVAELQWLAEQRTTVQIRSGDEDMRLRFLEDSERFTAQVLTLRAQLGGSAPTLDRLAVRSVVLHKGRLLDALALRRIHDARSACDHLAMGQARLADELTRAYVTRADPRDQDRIRWELRRLEHALSTCAPVPPDEASEDVVDSLQAALEPDTALVELIRYHPYDPGTPGLTPGQRYGTGRYVAYVMTHEGIEWVELGPARPIEDLANRFHTALSRHEDADRLGRKVDEQLMRPIRARLGGRTRVLVSPDAALHFIPLSALVDEHGDYLLERYTITTLESGRDLLRLDEVGPSLAPPVVFADPELGERPDGRPPYLCGEYCELPGTAREATILAHRLPDLETNLADALTETRFKQLGARSIIHVATHATAGDLLGTCYDSDWTPPDDATCHRGIRLSAPLTTAEPPPSSSEWDLRGDSLLRTGLLFSGVNGGVSGQDDGFLSALEVSGVDLLGTQLVVLSACDTGRGDHVDGQGVLGLRRAFAVAGVQTLVMTLWAIDDDSTPPLQAELYDNLRSGMGRTEALREAQRAALRSGKYAHPYYWAGFEISGVPGPVLLEPASVPVSSDGPWWWVLAGLALGGTVVVLGRSPPQPK